jgi:hypothetical protein
MITAVYGQVANSPATLLPNIVLPPFINIRCFRFVKQMNLHTKSCLDTFVSQS